MFNLFNFEIYRDDGKVLVIMVLLFMGIFFFVFWNYIGLYILWEYDEISCFFIIWVCYEIGNSGE